MSGVPGPRSAVKRSVATTLLLLLVALLVSMLLPRPVRPEADQAPQAVLAAPGEASATELSAPEALRPARQEQPADSPETPVARARIRGRVTDVYTGAPLTGATVSGIEPETTSGMQRLNRFETTSGPDGWFEAEVEPATYLVNAIAVDYVQGWVSEDVRQRIRSSRGGFRVPWILEVGEAGADRLDIQLEPAAQVRGLVRDESGAALAGATVSFACQMIGPKGCFYHDMPDEWFTTKADATGRFHIDHLYPEGSIELVAAAPGFASLKIEHLLASRTTELTIRLSAAPTIGGIVVDARGKPVPEATVFLHDTTSEFGCRCLTVRSGDDGTFVFGEVPAGALWVAGWKSGSAWATQSLAGLDTARLRLVLPEALGQVSGVVRDETGKFVVGAKVAIAHVRKRRAGLNGVLVSGVPSGGGSFVYSPDYEAAVELPRGSPLAETVTTDECGEFVFENLCFAEGQSVRLAVVLDGFRTRRVDVTASARLDLTLRPGKTDDADEEGVLKD